MKESLGPALRIFGFFTVLLGVAYPLLMTAVAQALFPRQANGSLIERNGQGVGSALIAQKFERPEHFWARPSAVDFNPLPSGGSNLGPTSQDLVQKVAERAKTGVTGELLYASASGLDPHISPAAALAQVTRVARATGLDPKRLEHLVAEHTEDRQLKILGEPRVNVLELNLALEVYRKP